ncbi:type II secretion system F family protein [Alkalicoccus urumqiensis]|uniref:Type II secretion system protein GspF domain-containing protein n=1 Tax=Alkalicoccus urumqiensis TaxID=1548213 RepID=A0A2P6MK82_ALKUR|nr:type II secretion system F family protein [Alkalicoccus urumqiensis]PRO66687.1 hypothetical protein C6I21_01805 [Alkalicoccus urumqiensis]
MAVSRKIFSSHEARASFLLNTASILREGYSIKEAVMLLDTFLSGRTVDWLHELEEDMAGGSTFSEPLAKAGFPAETVHLIKMMESHGSLIEGLEQAGELLQSRSRTQKQLRQVMYYPMFLCISVLVLAAALLQGILPQFRGFFDAVDYELPWMTKVLLFAADWLLGPAFFAAAAAGGALFLIMRRKTAMERVGAALKVPGLKGYMQRILTYYFCAQLAPMMKQGRSLQESLRIIEEEAVLPFFQLEAAQYLAYLSDGEPFEDILRSRECYVPQLADVWSIGGLKGSQAQELQTFAGYMFRQLSEKTNRFVALIQPIVFCVIGGVVILLFMSMMMPVFSIVDTI